MDKVFVGGSRGGSQLDSGRAMVSTKIYKPQMLENCRPADEASLFESQMHTYCCHLRLFCFDGLTLVFGTFPHERSQCGKGLVHF